MRRIAVRGGGGEGRGGWPAFREVGGEGRGGGLPPPGEVRRVEGEVRGSRGRTTFRGEAERAEGEDGRPRGRRGGSRRRTAVPGGGGEGRGGGRPSRAEEGRVEVEPAAKEAPSAGVGGRAPARAPVRTRPGPRRSPILIFTLWKTRSPSSSTAMLARNWRRAPQAAGAQRPSSRLCVRPRARPAVAPPTGPPTHTPLAGGRGGGGASPPTALSSFLLAEARGGAGAGQFRPQHNPNYPLAEG